MYLISHTLGTVATGRAIDAHNAMRELQHITLHTQNTRVAAYLPDDLALNGSDRSLVLQWRSGEGRCGAERENECCGVSDFHGREHSTPGPAQIAPNVT